MILRRFVFLAIALFFGASTPQAKEVAENTRLYTQPDPSATGGITGRITSPATPIELIVASSASEPENLFKGELDPANPGSFSFKGLPPGRYDLIVFYPGSFYEGATLSRDGDTLTPQDRESINATFQKSEPYFIEKVINRLEGQTGRGNEARLIGSYYRNKGSELMLTTHEGKFSREDGKRTVKLVILKEVGIGWQIVKTRNIYPFWAPIDAPPLVYHHAPDLAKIRVASEVKDIGDLKLN